MKSVSNVKGSLMYKDEELIRFSLHRGCLEYFEQVSKENLPIDFLINKNKEDALLIFLSERVVPCTRIGIDEEVKKIGLDHYDPDALIRFNHGRSVEDDYWVKFEDGVQTYDELLKRLKSYKF